MKNLRLLIVDDEEAARYGIRRALESFGYDIAEAESAESAHALMAHDNFDLLLLDVNLPGISGLETLQQMRDSNCDAAVIIISGHGNVETAVRATKLGAFDFIEKPLSIEKTVLTVRNARPAPTATYRLQLRKEFGFADAAAVVPYLAQLGVSHVYGMAECVKPFVQHVWESEVSFRAFHVYLNEPLLDF